MFQRKTMDDLGRPAADESLRKEKMPVIVILDDVRSMHNVGSAFRTADAFAVQYLYLCGFTPTPPHRDIRKTALGAEESVYWQQFISTEEAILDARQKGYKIFAVEQAHESVSLRDTDWSQDMPVAFIFGNEVTGVSDAALAGADACIEIPQFGAKHSINVSVSIGVVLWEVVRSLQAKQ